MGSVRNLTQSFPVCVAADTPYDSRERRQHESPSDSHGRQQRGKPNIRSLKRMFSCVTVEQIIGCKGEAMQTLNVSPYVLPSHLF